MASDGEQPLVIVGVSARIRVSVKSWANPDLNPNLNSSAATLTSSTPTLTSLTPNPDQVSNAPAAWEEDDALQHMSDVGSLVITPRVT